MYNLKVLFRSHFLNKNFHIYEGTERNYGMHNEVPILKFAFIQLFESVIP